MEKIKILIVEDDREVARMVSMALRSEGFQYELADDGISAMNLIDSYRPDVIILDLNLPEIDGIEVIRRVRESMITPIIVISAREEDSDKVFALDQGADDYLVKPFSIDELLARVRGVLRRVNYDNQVATSADPTEYQNGELFIDFFAREVKVNGIAVHLTPIEYQLLLELSKNTARVLTHHYLLKSVWGHESIEDTSSLRVNIATLRKKIEQHSEFKYIQTHIGVGYQMLKK